MSVATEVLKTEVQPVFLLETTAGRTAKWWEQPGLDPLVLQDATIVLDARRETAYADQQLVPTVKEHTGVTGDFTQGASSRQAKWVASAQNGKPAFRFVGNDGIGDIYTRALGAISTTFDPEKVTYVIAFKWDGADQDGVIAFGSRFPDDTNRVLALQLNGTGEAPFNHMDFQHQASGQANPSPAGMADNWHVAVARRKSDESWAWYVDGVLVASFTVAGTLNTAVAGTLFWGGFADDFHFHWHGDQAVFAHYKRDLTDLEVAEVTRNLAKDYAVTASVTPKLWRTTAAREVAQVKHNGAVLTQRSSAVDVLNNPGSWYWDRTHLWVRLSGDADPRTESNTVVVFEQHRFATRPKTFNDKYYEPGIESLPDLSLRVEGDFTGLPQVGGGSVKFQNGDKYFDQLSDHDWDAGRTVVKLGIDRPQDGFKMDYADYVTIGTWLNEWHDKDDVSFTLGLKEVKYKLKTSLPFSFYDRDSYPNVAEGEVGRPVQKAWGQVFGAAPVAVDVAAKKFKLADHAIYSVDEVRVARANGWDAVGIANLNLAAAEFTVPTWDGESNLSVDFKGKTNPDGTWMSNASDMVKDVLALISETNLDTASFAASRAKLVKGTATGGALEEAILVPSIYLEDEEDALEVVERVNRSVGSYLFVGPDGKYRYVVFEPVPGEGLPAIEATDTEQQVLDRSFQDKAGSGREPSKVMVVYAERLTENWAQNLVHERAQHQHSKDESFPVTKTVEVDLASTPDAQYWAERNLLMTGRTARETSAQVAWRGFTFLPADQVRVVYTRHGLDEVKELLEVTVIPSDARVSLAFGDRHAWKDQVGFWVNDSDVLPTRFAGLAGYGSGSLDWNKNWDPAIKRWARQNVGYWTDDNGFVDPEDAESYLASVWF